MEPDPPIVGGMEPTNLDELIASQTALVDAIHNEDFVLAECALERARRAIAIIDARLSASVEASTLLGEARTTLAAVAAMLSRRQTRRSLS